MPEVTCKISGCENPVKARGWCNRHWSRWNKHGDPLAGGTAKGDVRRFADEASHHIGKDDCLFWPFPWKGVYPTIGLNGKTVYAHRYVCIQAHGQPSDDRLLATHSCGKGHLGCVNPHHLRWGTHATNSADAMAHGTNIRGEKHPSAKIKDADVAAIVALKGVEALGVTAKRFGVASSTISQIQNRKSRRSALDA